MKFLTYIILTFSAIVNAQLSIGNQVNSTNVSLQFDNTNTLPKGLILPWVSTVANSPVVYNATTGAGYQGLQGNVVEGTLIFDLSDRKIKVKNSANSWFDLTGNLPLDVNNPQNKITSFNSINSSSQDNKKEDPNSKIIIGNNFETETSNGILVLADKDKAMVLPKVASPHLNIINPSPGLIAYDTNAKQLAVYNGTIWSFWKPQ